MVLHHSLARIASSVSAAEFTTFASSWLAAISVVSGALYILIRLNITRIQELQALINENTKKLETHEKALNGALGKDSTGNEHV